MHDVNVSPLAEQIPKLQQASRDGEHLGSTISHGLEVCRLRLMPHLSKRGHWQVLVSRRP